MSNDDHRAKKLSKYLDGDYNSHGRNKHRSRKNNSANRKKGLKHNQRKLDASKEKDRVQNSRLPDDNMKLNNDHNSENKNDDNVYAISGVSKIRRYDSNSASSTNDSDSNARQQNENPNRHRPRYESSSHISNERIPRDESQGTKHIGLNQNKPERYDSSSEASTNSKSIDERTPDDDDVETDKGKLKSYQPSVNIGHSAGLQSGSTFATQESEIQRNRKADALRMVDKYGVGETIYRDNKKGRLHDEEAENPLNEQEQHILQTSRTQRLKMEEQRREFTRLQQTTFARYKDDRELQEYHTTKIHKDDPMAVYAIAKQQHERASEETVDNKRIDQQPVYKGPPPKPNRFGIRPGYRWDAHDRGNGFEDRLLAKRFSAQHQSELSYHNSSADM